jgi:hypothetical protein
MIVVATTRIANLIDQFGLVLTVSAVKEGLPFP